VAMVERGLAESRAAAQGLILAGEVRVDGQLGAKPSQLVTTGTHLEVIEPPAFVSRGGEKLDAALASFGLEVAGKRCADVGASTGGFTDCLLQRGAAHVVALDVGRAQLAYSLRTDPRVAVLEQTDIRALDPEAVGGLFGLCTADLSFISLIKVAPALVRCTTESADLLLLVKPQFEVGRGRVPRGGVIRDPAAHEEVLVRVVDALADAGLPAAGVIPSPVRGADGNVEFVLWCRRAGSPIPHDDLVAAVAAAPEEKP
jgi:23S rRNA (cytidine1920-2'-O)/16S rRNA (cytidine1409-2'-O)-methyltransferase